MNHIGPYEKLCGRQKHVDGSYDVSLEADGCAEGWEAGVLLRASSLSDGGEGEDKELGNNFFIGYRVSISEKSIKLWKHRYNEKLLAECECMPGTKVQMNIEVVGNLIEVRKGKKVVLSYKDPEPIMCGYNGFHVRKCMLVEGEIC